MKDYDKNTLPHDHSGTDHDDDAFQLSIIVHPIAIGDIDELNEELSSVFGFFIFWKDSYIKWEPENNHNITSVTFGVDEVWKPGLMVLNPHQQDIKGQNMISSGGINFGPNGDTEYLMMMTTHTTCEIETTYFPFDIQSCAIEFLVGQDPAHVTNISCGWTNKEFVKGNGAWKLVNESIYSNTSITFSITLSFGRKPMFMLLNILLPLIVLVTLSPMVFLLSKGSSERIAYSLTMLLSISVYMTIVNEYLPKNSDPMPLISVMVFLWYIFTALIVLIVILNIQISRIKDKRRVPGCVCGFVKLTRFINRKQSLSYSASEEENEPCLESKNENGNDDTCKESHATPIRVTWMEVSVAIDKWCFITFYVIKFVVPAIILTIIS
ncbi:hypothetical protein ACF0H5_012112 [Mactra antiquata]